MNDPSGRTHEPGLRELVAEVDGLREVMLSKIEAIGTLLNERDKLYTERDNSRRTAVEAALAAAKENTANAFNASEKAIVKAEEAQKSYNASHNDLARKMDDQSKATMPRAENESRLRSLEEKINEVRNAFSAEGGVLVGSKATKDESRANLAILLSFGGLIVAILISWFKH